MGEKAKKDIGVLWGIDLGGTKIEIVAIRVAPFETLLRKRIDTEQKKGYQHIISQIKKLINLATDELGISCEKIGIGTPGSIDPKSGKMRNSNTVCLNGTPFLDDLKTNLNIDVQLANDADCLTLSETKAGIVAKQYPNAHTIFGIIMGTGVGGGLVIDGKLLTGRMGIVGEWGHNPLDDSGGICYCGKLGCVERVISGSGLERYYLEQTGRKKTLKEIYKGYKEESDAKAKETIERLFFFFGKALAVVINLYDPDIVVIGGGVGNILELPEEGRKSCERFVFNTYFDTPIVTPILGDSAGVFGAAFLSE